MSNKYYIHIIQPATELEHFKFLDLNDAESIESESVEAIYINDLLDYIEENEVNKILRMLKSKLIQGGRLYIQGTDIKSLSASLIYGQIDIKTYKSMVYGLGKKSTYSISDIRAIIQDMGDFKIFSIEFLNASQYYIECLKHE